MAIDAGNLSTTIAVIVNKNLCHVLVGKESLATLSATVNAKSMEISFAIQRQIRARMKKAM